MIDFSALWKIANPPYSGTPPLLIEIAKGVWAVQKPYPEWHQTSQVSEVVAGHTYYYWVARCPYDGARCDGWTEVTGQTMDFPGEPLYMAGCPLCGAEWEL